MISISSFAKTVPKPSHQLTSTSFKTASPFSYRRLKIHCVHLKYSGSVVANSLSQSTPLPISIICLLKLLIFWYVKDFGSFPVASAYCSEGNPYASHPIGCNTLYPCIRLKRDTISVAVYPSMCPTCSPEAEGYGNISKT